MITNDTVTLPFDGNLKKAGNFLIHIIFHFFLNNLTDSQIKYSLNMQMAHKRIYLKNCSQRMSHFFRLHKKCHLIRVVFRMYLFFPIRFAQKQSKQECFRLELQNTLSMAQNRDFLSIVFYIKKTIRSFKCKGIFEYLINNV